MFLVIVYINFFIGECDKFLLSLFVVSYSEFCLGRDLFFKVYGICFILDGIWGYGFFFIVGFELFVVEGLSWVGGERCVVMGEAREVFV